MKRPLLWALAFTAAGILFSEFNMKGQYGNSFLCIVLFFVIIILVSALLYNHCKWYWVFIFPLFCLLGYVRYADSVEPKYPEAEALASAGTTVSAEGIVTDRSYTKSGRTKLIIKTDSIRPQNAEKAYEFKTRVMAVLEEDEDAEPGLRITVRGTLETLDRPSNPGGFDEYAYYRPRDITYKMFPIVESLDGRETDFVILLGVVKNRLADVFDAAFLPQDAAIMKSIVIGDKSDLDESVKELYRLGGIYHILAISGLHISILVMAVRFLLSTFCGKRTGGVITLILIAIYCLMTGAGPSTVRAVIMCGVIIVGELLYRESDLLTSTAFACMCILLVRPSFMWDAGFQFSFAAVFGLATLSQPIERGLVLLGGRSPILLRLLKNAKAKSMIAGNLAALLATYPVSSYHFYYITPYSFFVNLLILPTVTVLVIMGFIVGLVGLLHVPAAVFLAGTAAFILRYYEWICSFFSGLPLARLLTGSCGVPISVICYAVLLSLAYMLRGVGTDFSKRRRYFYFACAVLMAAIAVKKYRPPGLDITMLDVGQGDCFVLREGSNTFVIDGGGWRGKEQGENTGARVLAPYLDYLGIGAVQGVFVTHMDDDHAAGIVELPDYKRVSQIYLSGESIDLSEGTGNPLYRELINICDRYRIPLYAVRSGDTIEAGALVLDILYPTAEKIRDNVEDSNDTSLVIMLSYNGTHFLFTGDIDAQAEEYLVKAGTDIKADILKLAHHGSRNSNSEGFIRAVNPEAAIVSAAKNNVYGHPSGEVVDTLRGLRIPLYGTMDSGAVMLHTEGEVIRVETMGDRYERIKE